MANQTSVEAVHYNMTTCSTQQGNNMTREEIIHMIIDWLQIGYVHWIFIVLFVIIFFTGITGNFLVCYSVWRSSQLKSVTNFFLVNLAVADFLVILICLPPTILYDTLQSWFFGLALCKAFNYLQRVSVFVSVLTLMAISIERYLAICHPLKFHGASVRTKLAIAVIWTISLLTPCIDLFNMTTTEDKLVPEVVRPWLTRCHVVDEQAETKYNIFVTVLFYLLPLVSMSFAYIKIAYCLWSSTLQRNAVSETLQHDSAIEQLNVRRRTAKMLVVIIIAFAVCYFPTYFLNIVRYSNLHLRNELSKKENFWVWMTVRFLTYFNSCINPIVYNFMSVKFRKQFKTACFGCYTCLRCCRNGKHGEANRHTEFDTSRSIAYRSNNVRLTFVASHPERHQNNEHSSENRSFHGGRMTELRKGESLYDDDHWS